MKSLGVYIADGTVRVAELTGSARRPRLVRVGAAPVPEGARPGETLGEVIRKTGMAASRVCVSLRGEGAVVRRLVLPITNPRAVQRAVQFEAEALLCGEALEDVIVDHEVVGPAADGGTEVLVLIVRKRDVSEALATLSLAGIEGGAVTVDGVAVFNLAAASASLAEEGRTAVLDFDGTILRILVSEGGRLEVFRTVQLGGGGKEKASAEDAARELERTLAGAEIEDPLSRILVAGNGTENVRGSLSERFLAPVEVLHAGRALGAEDVMGSDAASVAAGAALKGLGAEKLAADFRKGEFALPGEVRRVFFLGVYALFALALLFAIFFANGLKRLGAATATSEDLNREAKEQWTLVYPKKPFPRVGFDRYITKLKKKPAGASQSGPRYASFLEALLKVSNASPGEGIQLQALSFDQQKVVLAGEVDGMERFESLVQNLKARFGVRVKPHMERRLRGGGEPRTLFKIEIPRGKDVR
ncbi:MAG: type IV pilus biogenesis protein PilM [Planctomycetota bacterium]|jgi:hypothetical protein